MLAEKTGDQVLTFYYDDRDRPVSVELNGTRYYYRQNLQGDVIGLYSGGAQVVSYTYDPWGKLLSITDTSGTDIGAINPLRYRGYYYDTETGFYFLQSRYYDPTMGRFINADGYVSTGQGISSYNMFAYCLNDPVNHSDPDGNFCITACIIVIASGAVIGGALGALNSAATGGNTTEGFIEGFLLGGAGSALGLFLSPALAIPFGFCSGAIIDTGTQLIANAARNEKKDFDYGRLVKTSIQTSIGTMIPGLGDPKSSAADAIATVLIWNEASTLVTISDVIVSNAISNTYTPRRTGSKPSGGGRALSQRRSLLV